MKNSDNKLNIFYLIFLGLIINIIAFSYSYSQNSENVLSAENTQPTNLTNILNDVNNIKNDEIKNNENLIPKIPKNNKLNRIDRREKSKIGLASIGLDNKDIFTKNINSLAWKNTSSKDAIYLLKNIPAYGSSRTLNDLVTTLVLRPSASLPDNSEEFIEKFIVEKLNWLARSGKSDYLSELISQLPEEELWKDWKKWQIEYDLMKGSYESACMNAEENVQTSIEMFWQKYHIICLILNDNNSKASFKADLIKHSGENDDNFFKLIDKILKRKENINLDLEKVTPLHLALMEVAREEIPLSAINQLPLSMSQATKYFDYLETTARLHAKFKGLTMNLNTHHEIEQLLKSFVSSPKTVEETIVNLENENQINHSNTPRKFINSALLWIGLNKRNKEDKDLLIQAGFLQEFKASKGQTMLPLYAGLIRNRLNENTSFELKEDVKEDFAAILTFANVNLPQHEKLINQDKSAHLREILNLKKGMKWNPKNFDKLDCWSVIPLIHSIGVFDPKIDWIERFHNKNNSVKNVIKENLPIEYIEISQEHKIAIRHAAVNEESIAKVVLLISLAIKDHPLHKIKPEDGRFLVNAFRNVNLEEESFKFAREILLDHLINIYWSKFSKEDI